LYGIPQAETLRGITLTSQKRNILFVTRRLPASYNHLQGVKLNKGSRAGIRIEYGMFHWWSQRTANFKLRHTLDQWYGQLLAHTATERGTTLYE
jgi:hypothetical protein